MLSAATRYKLHFGPYRPSRRKLGAIVNDEIRGEVRIVDWMDARIPWPIGKQWRYRALLVERTLARAVRRESVQAVAHWWGISTERVRVLRRALGVPVNNEGSSRLRKTYAQTPAFRRAARKAWANAGSPERRAMAAAAMRGRVHPAAVRRKISAALRARIVTPETRRKLSAAAKARGTRPPKAGRPWTAQENALLHDFSNKEVAERTGRTVKAAWHQRKLLGFGERKISACFMSCSILTGPSERVKDPSVFRPVAPPPSLVANRQTPNYTGRSQGGKS